MGCSGSKADHTPLVVFCRERRDLALAAANFRDAFAASHVSYFLFLKDVGDALQKFVNEELIAAELTLPQNYKDGNPDDSVSHVDDDSDDDSHLQLSDCSSGDGDSEDYPHHFHESEENTYQHQPNHQHHGGRGSEDDMHQHRHHSNNHYGHAHKGNKGSFHDDQSHLHFEEESSSDFHHPQGGFNEFGGNSGFNGFGGSFSGFGGGMGNYPFSNQHHYPNPHRPYGEPHMDHHYSNSTNVHFMKKGAPAAHTVIQEPPAEPSYGYSNSHFYHGAGYVHSGDNGYVSNGNVRVNQKKEAPPPPSPPKVSVWDSVDPFLFVNNDYYSGGLFGHRSSSSSPDDSTGVREREGIPELEEETESEVYETEALKRKKGKKSESKTDHSYYNSESSSSRKLPLPKNKGKSKQVPMVDSESSSKSVPSWSSEEPHQRAEDAKKTYTPSQPSVLSPHSEGTSCVVESPSEDFGSSFCSTEGRNSPEIFVMEQTAKRKEVENEVGEASSQDAGDSSKLSSATISLAHGTRDLREAVAEIRDEFQAAAGYGKEVAVMLEVGKLPYQPSFLKAILSQILYPISPSLSSRDPPSMQSAKLASKNKKLAKSYFEDVGKYENTKACYLSSTLGKLCAWEKKLYKEVKDIEKIRIMHENQRMRLKNLDQKGAEQSKIDAARASITQLETRLNVCHRAIIAISTRIDKLRDKELQPQVTELIHGLIRMWKAMLKCHQKQFKAVMESKLRRLTANTSLQTDPTSRATTELERELRAWCDRFNDWIDSQKSYVESLNGWILHCIKYEPEVTPDGPVPYSPGHLGAPPAFVVCNDWHRSMNAVSEVRVENAMKTFATTLRKLWETQNEEGRQRQKAEYYEKQLLQQQQEGLSVVASDQRDDLKVDLDSMRQKIYDKRAKHKDAMDLVHKAASSSLQGGLIPIFKALEDFTSDALKAHEQVRLQQPELG